MAFKTDDDWEPGEPSPIRAMAKKGGETTKTLYGSDYYTKIGKQGGVKTALRGKDYFSMIGKLGAAAKAAKKKG